MTPRLPRELYPWEAHCGCPRCHVKPGMRCVTTRPIHMPPWSERELRFVGSVTSPHLPRYRLWACLFLHECGDTLPPWT